MRPRVHISQPVLARRLQFGEARIAGPQVLIAGQQVGFGDPHRRLAAAFALRVGGHARLDRHAIVARDADDLRLRTAIPHT
jgi:hypothetical protein